MPDGATGDRVEATIMLTRRGAVAAEVADSPAGAVLGAGVTAAALVLHVTEIPLDPWHGTVSLIAVIVAVGRQLWRTFHMYAGYPLTVVVDDNGITIGREGRRGPAAPRTLLPWEFWQQAERRLGHWSVRLTSEPDRHRLSIPLAQLTAEQQDVLATLFAAHGKSSASRRRVLLHRRSA